MFENVDDLLQETSSPPTVNIQNLNLEDSESDFIPRPGRKLIKAQRNILDSLEEDVSASYSYVFDNVNTLRKVRHEGPHASNMMTSGTTGYLVKNRIPYTGAYAFSSEKNALEVDTNSFLLSNEEKDILFEQKVSSFKTVAVTFIRHLQETVFRKQLLNNPLSTEIESSQKSSIVPLGYLDEEESSINGNIRILEVLQKNTPIVREKKAPIIVVGDQLTYSRIESMKIVRAQSVNNDDFNNIYPSFGDLHRRMTLLRDVVATFSLYLASKNSTGSLAQIKDMMGFKNASSNVNESFNSVYELVVTAMNGLAVDLLMTIMEISDIEEVPPFCPDISDEKACAEYLVFVCRKAAKAVQFLESPKTESCSCGGKDNVLQCDNYTCKRLFHHSCFPESVLASTDGLHGTYCSLFCSDRIYHYSVSLLHACMCQVERHDAIRRNDADLIYLHIKEDCQTFMNEKNPHYLKLGIHYLLSQAGCVPPQIKHDMRYNRTVNPSGETLGNLEEDLMCERLVKDAKEQMKIVKGEFNVKALQRRTQIGETSKAILKNLQYETDVTFASKYTRHLVKEESIKIFVSKTLPAKLFQVVGPRAHPTLENFNYYLYLKCEKEFLEQTNKIRIEYGTLQKLFSNYTGKEMTKTDSQVPENEDFTVDLKNRYSYDVPTVKFGQDRRFCSVRRRFPNLPATNDIQFDVYEFDFKRFVRGERYNSNFANWIRKNFGRWILKYSSSLGRTYRWNDGYNDCCTTNNIDERAF